MSADTIMTCVGRLACRKCLHAIAIALPRDRRLQPPLPPAPALLPPTAALP